MGPCLYSTGFISRTAPRSFPFIKGNARGADPEMKIIPMDCQFASININWQRLRIIRIPPLNIFRECSRPMRSLDSELSTNERPRFWPDSWHVPNFDPSNAPPIGFFSMAASVEFHSSANGMPIKCQWNNH